MRTRLLLLVPDGAAGALEPAVTPAWDALPYARSLHTVPAGLPVASEVALPTLLGATVPSAPARGPVEASSLGLDVADRTAAWRLDLGPGPAVSPDELSTVLGATVHHLRRDRHVLLGPARWLADGGTGSRQEQVEATTGRPARLWGGGRAVALPTSPWSTVVVAAPTGAAAGVARLLGADVVSPPGATGFPDSDLTGKAEAAAALVDGDQHEVVVVHVGAPDEAGHARDAAAQRASVERFDRHVIAPLASLAADLGVPVAVVPDHATDPATGRHVGGPVPARATVPLPDGGACGLVPAILGSGVPV